MPAAKAVSSEGVESKLETLDPPHLRKGAIGPGSPWNTRPDTRRHDVARPEARVMAQASIAIRHIGLRGDHSIGIRMTEPSNAEG